MTSLQVHDALSISLPEVLALPDPEAAEAVSLRLVALDNVERRAFSERCIIVHAVERRKLWQYLEDPDTGETFANMTAFMSCSYFLGCRRTNFEALRVVKLLEDIPTPKLLDIPKSTLHTMTQLSTAVRNDPEILEAAKTLPPNEFVARIEIEHPNQHVQSKKPLRLNPDRDEREAIDRWVEHCKEKGDAVTTEEAIAMACTMALHDSELDEELAAMPQERGSTEHEYSFLLPKFLEAMNDIGRYGNEKYGKDSFHARRKKGDCSRGDMKRTTSQAIADHAREHFSMYLSYISHDHFKTDIHQLAAVAFNAMMECYFAGLTEESDTGTRGTA